MQRLDPRTAPNILSKSLSPAHAKKLWRNRASVLLPQVNLNSGLKTAFAVAARSGYLEAGAGRDRIGQWDTQREEVEFHRVTRNGHRIGRMIES